MIGWIVALGPLGPSTMIREVVLVSMALHGVADLPPNPDAHGIASRFGDPGDKHIGGTLACKPEERVSITDHQCAHRYYPCGTILIIENSRNKKRTWCEVADRGPYGANVFVSKEDRTVVYTSSGKKAWYVKKRKGHAPPEDLCPSGSCVGRWRGILDMSPAVSNALGHNGFERVNVYRLKSVIRYHRYVDAKIARLSM